MEAGAPTLLRHAPPARRAAAPDSAQRALRPMPRRGPRKIKASPGRPGVTVSRRRACRIIGGGRPGRRMRQEEVQGAPRGGQRGRRAERRRARPRRQGAAHPYMRRPGLRVRYAATWPTRAICGDLAYVCVGASWSCARLLVDPRNRGGSSATPPGPERTPGRSSRRSRRPPSRSRTSRYSTRTAAASSTTPRST